MNNPLIDYNNLPCSGETPKDNSPWCTIAQMQKEEIKQLKDKLKEASKCKSCGGSGKRWYVFRGWDMCETCWGNGYK